MHLRKYPSYLLDMFAVISARRSMGMNRMGSNSCRLILCVSRIICLYAGLPARTSDAASTLGQSMLVEELKRDGPVAWARLDESLSHCEFQYEINETFVDAQQTTNQFKRVKGQVSDDLFLITEILGSTGVQYVYGRNEEYEFAIRRNGGAPWELEWQGKGIGNETAAGSACSEHFGQIKLGWHLSEVPLSRLVASERFLVETITKDSHGDIDVVFKVSPVEDAVEVLQNLESGHIALSPGNSWAIKSYNVTYRGGMTCSMDAMYGERGAPYYSKLSLQVRPMPNHSSRFVLHDVACVTVASESFPKEKCGLAYYGLPEYRSQAGSRRRVWFVLINIGAILLFLGLLARRQWKKE